MGMKTYNLGTARYTPEQRRKIFKWLERAEPTGYCGMVPKGVTPKFPAGCKPEMEVMPSDIEQEMN